MSQPRVLIIDDEPDMLENCERLLARAGYTTRALTDPTRLKAELAGFAPDALLLDLRMPVLDGMAVLPAALAEDPLLPVIIIAAGVIAILVGSAFIFSGRGIPLFALGFAIALFGWSMRLDGLEFQTDMRLASAFALAISVTTQLVVWRRRAGQAEPGSTKQ